MASTKRSSHWQRDKNVDLFSFGVWICLGGKYFRQVAYDLETEEEARYVAERCASEARVVRFTLWD